MEQKGHIMCKHYFGLICIQKFVITIYVFKCKKCGAICRTTKYRIWHQEEYFNA